MSSPSSQPSVSLPRQGRGRRVFVETHGCKLNLADSEAMARRFVQAGYAIVPSPEAADVCVVNTCTVTSMADRKARKALNGIYRHNPRAVLVATGCYAQRAPQVLEALESVSLVVGNTDKDSLVERVIAAQGLVGYREDPHQEPTYLYPGLLTRAMVKIQEGCDQVCAYCIVPKVRGRERSIPPKALVARVQAAVKAGFREVVLTGTQLGSYGFDLPGVDLPGLVRRILAETEVERLRVSSIQAQELTEELLGLWSDERLCPHFHLPLQSGSDSVLHRMRRCYTRARYAQAVEMVRRSLPHASITTDVIVGFPGETAEEFQESYSLCRSVGFAAMHLFPFSARPGTTAFYLRPHVPAPVKEERMNSMQALAREQAAAFRRSCLGCVRPVLWEAPLESRRTRRWVGLTDTYVRVYTHSNQPLANTISHVRLEALDGEMVRARLMN